MNQPNEGVQQNHNIPSNPLQNFNQTSPTQAENQYLSAIKAIEEKYEKLQNDLATTNQKNEELQKVKDNLENQSQKYGLLYKDELDERKEWQNKYVVLQEQHTQKIESF